MKKIFYLLFAIPFIFVACDDNAQTIDLPTEVFNDSRLVVNIDGVNEAVLINTSLVSTEYSSTSYSFSLNNVVDPRASLITDPMTVTLVDGGRSFEIKKITSRYNANLQGVISNGVCTIKGDVTYKPLGVARLYKDLTLRINDAASKTGTSAEVKFVPTDKEPNKATIKLNNIVEGLEEITLEGTLVEGENNTFNLTTTGTDEGSGITVDLAGIFVEGVLSITVTSNTAQK